MPAAFAKAEYDARLARTREKMTEARLDTLVVGDPANINWLTGYDAWSFYVPQAVVVTHHLSPLWIGRPQDINAVYQTTHLTPADVASWPERLLHRDDAHPGDAMAAAMAERGLDQGRIGYEGDNYAFSPRTLDHLRAGLPNAEFVDADRLVNWCRTIKSEAEIAVMRQAGELAIAAMKVALEGLRPGVRQCDLVAEVLKAQVAAQPAFGGDLPAIWPLVLAGEAAACAHPLWTDDAFGQDQTVAFELAGARKRYNVGMARTAHIGTPPERLLSTARAVDEGMDAVLATIRAGVTAGEVHRVWQDVLDRYGLTKESRIGYAIGIGYPPDWGEHTVSLRADEPTVLAENMTLHVMLGMWLDDWGMELSESIRVTDGAPERLAPFDRAVHVID